MKIRSMTMTVTTAMSATGIALAAQSFAKDYTQSMHTQPKVNTQIIQPWHKGYRPEVQPWSRINISHLKGAPRMYNHGIKRV